MAATTDSDQLAELIRQNASRRDSKREREIRQRLRNIEETERLRVIQSMHAADVGGTTEIALSVLAGEQAQAFFGTLVAASDASSLKFALEFGEKKLSHAAMVRNLSVLMSSRPELLSSLKYWSPVLWNAVTHADERLRALSEVRYTRTRPERAK